MTSLAPPIPDARSETSGFMPFKLAAIFGLAALADWLFYEQPAGISVVIFAGALFCCCVFANPPIASRKHIWSANVLAVAACIPAAIDLDTLSFLFVALGLGLAVAILTNPNLDGIASGVRALRELLVIAPFRLVRDALAVFNLPAFATGLAAWIVPVLMSFVFVLLFVSANPLLEKWLKWFDLARMAEYFSAPRILFWILVLSLVWPFVHVRWRQRTELQEPAVVIDRERTEFLDAATILRSLILFNLLFAVQTILDAVYLWGGVSLPADITYAAYAHRGAYPLIVTALLAAGFVLAAMRPGGPAERSRVIRPLVYLWVGQNVMLVISSILRLDLYVQTYLLTWWRVAAFIWMLLVATGLLLIVARIVLGRSNEWLVRLNLVALVTTLYVCSLVNLTAAIADYNIAHSREATGKGVNLDMNYLLSLGPHALPAIDTALKTCDPDLVSRRNRLVERFQRQTDSWRAWGLRNWRLKHYLEGRQQGSATG